MIGDLRVVGDLKSAHTLGPSWIQKMGRDKVGIRATKLEALHCDYKLLERFYV